MTRRAPRLARAALLALAFATASFGPAPAEERAQTLADLRSELETVREGLARLQRELAPGAGPATAEAVPDSVLDRVGALERSVQRLTAQAEELGFRIDAVVADGTNRIGDIEFRLNELEGGEPAAFSPPAPLGGQDAAAAPAPAPGPALVAGEQAAFDAAAGAHERGEYAEAEVALADFAEAYPMGALTARAHRLRADALEQLGEPARAARAWLAAFNADPDGAEAATALLGLGSALARLDQAEEACIMLDEVMVRFPDSAEAADAEDARAEIGCP